MAVIGYARVSTVEQHEDRQIKALQDAGCSRIYVDKLSGKDTNRANLKKMIDFVRDENDTVIVSEYSRLARSTKDLLNIIEEITAKGAVVKSLKENLDTSTPQGKLMLTVFAGLAEFERAIMLQRQKEGIAIAKEKGRYAGRVRAVKPDNWEELKTLYQTRKMTASELAKRCKVSRPTISKWLQAS